MKNYRYDIEMLSAYLDGELSPKEKYYIEQKIKSSLDLQRKLNELKKLKTVTNESKPVLEESFYFEERLMASLSSSGHTGEKLKKWIPVFTFSGLAAVLVFVLSINPAFIKNIIDEQKGNIADFYKTNLKPLLYAANLSSEDIFNFALNEELPLDPSNSQILKLSYDQTGKEYFEIKQNSEARSKNNLNNFVNALELDDQEKLQMDSLLKVYSEKISAQILVSDKNAIAINPNIWNLRKAVLADIISFAKKHGNENFQKIAPIDKVPLPDKNIVWLEKVKTQSPNDFIIVTPDSVFSTKIDIDLAELNRDIVKANEELNKAEKENRKHKIVFKFNSDSSYSDLRDKVKSDSNFRIFVHNNGVQVHLEKIDIPDFELPNFDSIASIINEAARNFSVVNVGPPSLPEVPVSKNYQVRRENNYSPSLRTREVNVDSVIEENNRRIELNNKRRQSNNRFYNDSSSNEIKLMVDSLIIKQNEELRKQIEQLRKEIEKFRQDMQNMKNKEKIEQYEEIIKMLEDQIEI